jgi:uncharacterized protein YukE
MFTFFQFIRADVDNVKSGVEQQKQIAQNLLDTITKSYVPKVQGAWVGKDCEEFAADVQRKLVPAMLELIAAIAGINLNLGKATSLIDQADQQVKGMADQLGDVFSQI